jgi:TonB family protein
MRRKSQLLAIGLTLMLGGSAALAPTIAAQENSSDAATRKVRTKVTPEYPALARQMHVTGKVKIAATIAADGHVTAMRVVGGSPLLASSATEALKKWHFEGGPKETTEIIEFDFATQAKD